LYQIIRGRVCRFRSAGHGERFVEVGASHRRRPSPLAPG